MPVRLQLFFQSFEYSKMTRYPCKKVIKFMINRQNTRKTEEVMKFRIQQIIGIVSLLVLIGLGIKGFLG